MIYGDICRGFRERVRSGSSAIYRVGHAAKVRPTNIFDGNIECIHVGKSQ